MRTKGTQGSMASVKESSWRCGGEGDGELGTEPLPDDDDPLPDSSELQHVCMAIFINVTWNTELDYPHSHSILHSQFHKIDSS